MMNCAAPRVAQDLVVESGSQFQALGRNWVLVPDDETGAGMSELLSASAVGSMNIAGRSYFIFAGNAESEPGGDHRMFGRVAEDVLAILTPRELQVCELIAAGRCDKHIARSLGISGYTVREYIRRIFAKLQISNRTAVLPRMLGLLGN